MVDPNPTRLIVGAMSGTSADGVDVALVEVVGRVPTIRARLIRHHVRPYEASLRRTIFELRRTSTAPLGVLAKLARDISLTYAAAVNETLLAQGISSADIACVAAHGQTLFHEPPLTMQCFDPSLVAHEVGCVVVSDFRRADCAAGGQGAPLVPLADQLLFSDPHKSRVLLNLGGIANLTYLRAGGTSTELIAFDTGPGNCLSDELCRLPGGTGTQMDEGGHQAMSGSPVMPLVYAMLRNEYFAQDPPKTTDVPTMSNLFAKALDETTLESGATPAMHHLLASACLITAKAIAESVRDFVPKGVDEVIASGGGTHNACIMHHLRAELRDIPVRTIDTLGIPSASKEAIAFALLGAATLDGMPGNIPSATGAHKAVVLGSITPRP